MDKHHWIIIGLYHAVYSVFELWLGRTKRFMANSFLDLCITMLRVIMGKIQGWVVIIFQGARKWLKL